MASSFRFLCLTFLRAGDSLAPILVPFCLVAMNNRAQGKPQSYPLCIRLDRFRFAPKVASLANPTQRRRLDQEGLAKPAAAPAQGHRHGGGMEGFKTYYKLGATGTFKKAEDEDAKKKAQKITIALRKAGALVTKIKEPAVKKEALELIEAYETELQAFQNELDVYIEKWRIAKAKEKIENEVDSLSIDEIMDDRHLFKKFTTFSHNEDVYQFNTVMKAKGKKGDRRDYDTFIKPGGSKEINFNGYEKAKAAQKVMIQMANDEDAGKRRHLARCRLGGVL